MNILSSFKMDSKHIKKQPGSFEWWYFDAVDIHDKYRLVIIFYEGIPFSTKYINSFKRETSSDQALAHAHPGMSISVYDRDTTIYYSLSEFKGDDCEFAVDRVFIRIGQSTLKGEIKDKQRVFYLNLDETLPCGDHIESDLTFFSHETPIATMESEVENGHKWFILQSQAAVQGSVFIQTKGKGENKIDFLGQGYHDHNFGNKPLHEMTGWYWGRFHFPNGTFIFYKTDDKEDNKSIGWWIDENGEMIHSFSLIMLDDYSFNPFLLKTARRLQFKIDEHNYPEIEINLIDSVDSGPFYQRFIAEAIAHFPGYPAIQRTSGIAEYIKPNRIQKKIFWPLIHMRYRYVDDKTHAVQRIASLYRLTW